LVAGTVSAVNKVAKAPATKPGQNKPTVKKVPIKERLAKGRIEADVYNAEREKYRKPKRHNDLDI